MTEKINKPKYTRTFIAGAVLAYISSLLLLMSFASPYWLQSYAATFSPFKKMGLWEFCFENFRYPRYQFKKQFTGCYYVFSEEYRIIREWILPAWLIVVQAFVSVAIIPSFLSLISIALVMMKFPLSLMKYEWVFLGISCLMEALCAPFLFLAVAIFGGQCWNRDWILYPNYNFLSWSYIFAVISMMTHSLSAISLYHHAKCCYVDAKIKRDAAHQNRNLVMQMHPGIGDNGYI